MKNKVFNFSSLEELAEGAKAQGFELPYSADTKILNESIKISSKTIKNRILIQPIEGFDAELDGSPSTRTFDRYCEMAKNGAGAIWIESVSVDEQGRSNKAQLWLREENVDAFKKLNDEIKKAAEGDVYTILQLTHSGRYSNPHGTATPISAFENPLIPKENEHIVTDDEVVIIEDDYVSTVLLAQKAGFDAVDIRSCHGYLINEFFSAYNRSGIYGGSFENRTRFLINIIDKVKKVSDIEIGVRLNMYDGLPYPYGWGIKDDGSYEIDLDEPLKLIKILYDKGVRLLNISNGIGAYSPYAIRPYDRGPIEARENQFVGIDRMMRCAKLTKEIAKDAVVIASAFTWLRTFAPNVGAEYIARGDFDILGFGRQALAYPEFSKDILSGEGMNEKRCCTACCGCTTMIKIKGEKLACVMKEILIKNAQKG